MLLPSRTRPARALGSVCTELCVNVWRVGECVCFCLVCVWAGWRRSSGDWEKALSVAEEHDRIHLKLTHHLYGKHLESIGDILGAVRQVCVWPRRGTVWPLQPPCSPLGAPSPRRGAARHCVCRGPSCVSRSLTPAS